MLTEAMKDRAKAIAIRYPVTYDYVCSLLEHWPPAAVIELLDVMSALGTFYDAETLQEQFDRLKVHVP